MTHRERPRTEPPKADLVFTHRCACCGTDRLCTHHAMCLGCATTRDYSSFGTSGLRVRRQQTPLRLVRED
jgi:hypothetical protein